MGRVKEVDSELNGSWVYGVIFTDKSLNGKVYKIDGVDCNVDIFLFVWRAKKYIRETLIQIIS